jgi:cytoskeletal protein RodZ
MTDMPLLMWNLRRLISSFYLTWRDSHRKTDSFLLPLAGKTVISHNEMSTVAEQLRTAREAQNLTVYQVAEVTKIRTDHIRALDEGNYDAFSAPVYIRGFVRTYATMLKLEVPKIMATLQAELSQTEKHHEHPPLTKQSKGIVDILMFQLSRVNWRIALPIGGTVILLLAVLWIFRACSSQKAKDPLADVKPAVYQPQKKSTGNTLPVPTQPRR